MRGILLVAVMGCLSVSARAQTTEELKAIEAWVLGGSTDEAKREAAVVKLFKPKPALAKGTKDGEPLLIYALDSADVAGDLGRRAQKLAELLIAGGADVNARAKGNPLILKYAMFARLEPMRILLAKQADPNATDADQRTSLHWLATAVELDKEPKVIARNLRAAQLLLENKATIDARDKWGKTPLALAAFIGSKRMVTELIARGADINAKDKQGYSVLGGCRLRVDDGPKKPTFANAKEKAATREVIKILVAKGAKDERPR